VEVILQEFTTKEFVSVTECAQALRCTDRTVRRLIQTRLLSAERFNPERGWYRIRRADLETYATQYGIQLAAIQQKN
jgi:excisionase family DNA binding protein